jgi:hypothetical protein
MGERGLVGIAKRKFKGVIDSFFDTVVGAVDGVEGSLSFSPKLRKKGSGKIDVVRRAFKYESLVYHTWRSIWCTYVTIVAFYNFKRMRQEFAVTYADADVIPYHSHHDSKTWWDIMMVTLFFSIDILIYLIRGKFMSRSVLTHHILGIVLCLVTLVSNYPHHYHANLFMCAEVVSCLTVLAHYSKKSRSRVLHKIYLLQYLLLTIFARGWIWYTVSSDLLANNVSALCYIGFLPLILMDVAWSRQCVQGLLK